MDQDKNNHIKRVKFPRRSNRISILTIIFLIVLGYSLFNIFYPAKNGELVGLNDIIRNVKEQNVNEVRIRDEKVEIIKKDGNVLYALTKPGTDIIKILQDEEGIDITQSDVKIEYVPTFKINFSDILNLLLLAGTGVLIVIFLKNMQSAGGRIFEFGKSKARMIFGKKPEVTFKDVAGVEEAKEELKEVVDFLKSPKKFRKMGARIPKGLLLVGPPGTGKTLFARAIAGEAGVPFFHTSGAEFEEMLVGAGASRVRDLFDKAKKAAPCIIFIDEIDAVARKRGTNITTGATEQTLNQILVEMDGFEKTDNVIVLAATNRPDVLDPALLRPGRFDRHVFLELPDVEGREAIIKIHAQNKPMEAKVDYERIARRTVGFSGADIENMLNEAAILTVQRGKKKIGFDEIEEASVRVMMGREKHRKKSKRDLEITAYHEAGHAVVTHFMPDTDPIHKISIISRGRTAGVTMMLPKKEEEFMTRTKLLSKIATLVAGSAAEEMVFSDVTTGSSSDIDQASSLVRKMVKKYGMSKKLGMIKYGQDDENEYLGYKYGEQKDYSEQTAREIDEEITRITKEAYDKAVKILTMHRKFLDQVAQKLLEVEVIDMKEFEEMAERYEKKGKKPARRNQRIGVKGK